VVLNAGAGGVRGSHGLGNSTEPVSRERQRRIKDEILAGNISPLPRSRARLTFIQSSDFMKLNFKKKKVRCVKPEANPP